MAYIDDAQFDSWRVALQKQLETSLVQRWEGDRIEAGLAAASGVTRAAAGRARQAAPKLVIPEMPRRKAPKKGSAASARAGHGRGKSRDVEQE